MTGGAVPDKNRPETASSPDAGGAAAAERESLAAQRQLALDAARMGWWHYDPVTSVATFDRRAGEILGVAGTELPRDDILRLIHPRDLRQAESTLDAALDPSHQGPFSIECRVRLPGGTVRWIEAHAAATLSSEDGSPRVTSVVGTLADVTSRRRVAEQRERLLAELRATVSSVTDGLIVYRPDGSYAFANPAAERIFDFGPDERRLVYGDRIRLARVSDETGAPVRPEDTPPWRALHGETVASQILRFRRRNGEAWISMGAAPIVTSTGERLGAVVVFTDITERKQTEEALEYSLERLWIAKDAARLGIYDLEIPAGTGSVDDRARELWGLEPAERTSLARLLAAVHADDRVAALASIARAADPRGEGRYAAELRVVDAGGRERWLAVTGHVVFSDGRPVRVIGTVQDISERKLAERVARATAERDAFRVRLADAVRPLADPVAVQAAVTRELGEELCASRVLYGEIVDGRVLVRADYTAEGVRSVVGSRRVEAFGPLHDALATGETLVVPERREGDESPTLRATYEALGVVAHVSVPLVKDGRLAAFLSAHQASPRRWTPDEVSLVEEVAERTWSAVERARAEEAMREANRRLEEEDRRKNEFLAILSHELRNPLAPIRNGLYVLERTAPGGPQALRAKEIMERQVDQLTRLVDDLLDVTRITRGKIQLHRERLELNELVKRTVEDHRSQFERAAVGVELHPAPGRVLIEADWNRVAQVVGNLLQNAAKFTPRGGRVTVTVAADEPAGQATVTVADTGVGMEPEVLARLFQPFMQADTTLDRSKGGLGLGLALVKGLVEQHGGTVEVKSPGLGHGAELTVRLPLGSREPATDRDLAPPRPASRRRVLVIEDNVESAESLREVLELDGHEVAVAYDGPDGIARARELGPDVVLCDIGLPGMDGYEVARVLRADRALDGVRLVALTGYALPDDVRRAADAGFERHLAKPASREKLDEVLADSHGPPAHG